MSSNDLIMSDFKLSLFEISIMKSLIIFYNNNYNIELINNILLIKNDFSIRLIDYFITKYSKINKINYYIDNSLFNVFISYKQQLKIYQKKYFDPCSRGNRIPFFFNNGTNIITTLGQLNFFKWFIEKNLYSYILNNYLIIENSMNINNKEIKEIKKNIKIIKKKNNLNYIKNKINYLNNNYNNLNTIVVSFSF